jgi:hypothetical protein
MCYEFWFIRFGLLGKVDKYIDWIGYWYKKSPEVCCIFYLVYLLDQLDQLDQNEEWFI